MFETIRAEGLAEGIIWLILFIVWIVAQVANRDKPKPGSPRPRPGQAPRPPDKPKNSEDSLRDFLERLDEAMKPAETPASSPPPLPQPQVQQPPKPPRAVMRSARREPAKHGHRNIAELKAAHANQKARLQERMSRVSKILKSKVSPERMKRYALAEEEAPASDFNFVATVDTKSEIVDLRSMALKINTVPVPSLSSAAPSSVEVDLKSRAAIRTAVMGRYILGPPKALAPDLYDYGKGTM